MPEECKKQRPRLLCSARLEQIPAICTLQKLLSSTDNHVKYVKELLLRAPCEHTQSVVSQTLI